jgi:tRNA U54 and U55 pseudouridine synthase Pus10
MMADFGVDRPLCAILSCAICLNDYTHGEVIQGSHHCQHVYHAECILKWLVKHQECPICRTDFGNVEEEVQEVVPELATPDYPATTTATTTEQEAQVPAPVVLAPDSSTTTSTASTDIPV